MVPQHAKHPKFSCSILFGMINDDTLPKYSKIEILRESTRNGSLDSNLQLPSPTQIVTSFPQTNRKVPISTTAGGFQIDERDKLCDIG
jgi:hypothetical protein